MNSVLEDIMINDDLKKLKSKLYRKYGTTWFIDLSKDEKILLAKLNKEEINNLKGAKIC